MSDSKAEATHGGMTGSQWVRMAIELGPLVVFFLLNSRADAFFGNAKEQNIFYATGGFMAATAISLAYSYVKFRKIPTMPLVTGIFVMVFGALTIWLQDDQFIKVKPTIVNALFAAALLGAAAMGKPVMKQLFDGAFNLTDKGWMILTVRWGLFFVLLGIVNEVVWRNFSTDFWVSFKLFGIMPLTMIFGIAQIPVLTKHAPKSETEAAE
ncbi:MAG: septation protein A [Parvibaculum sp.]|jgi:intracellular septation protein|uniref:septation protein A n=1 Tax=Parvibaculum sp. TaxID=2024848 RepID=UPI000CB172EB|nr:septation protein A [Parvibaculum sp.]MDZ4381222.1 septation protein A [Parvibaculum sp.]PKP76843.1 MAG: septation protein A [Alphaproteobacteria bacterium HGW-Alphaproteobacteria-3]